MFTSSFGIIMISAQSLPLNFCHSFFQSTFRQQNRCHQEIATKKYCLFLHLFGQIGTWLVLGLIELKNFKELGLNKKNLATLQLKIYLFGNILAILLDGCFIYGLVNLNTFTLLRGNTHLFCHIFGHYLANFFCDI